MDSKYELPENGLYAVIKTDKGEIVIKLEFEKTPLTVANFVGLAEGKIDNSFKKNLPFFNGLKFHRVVDNFVIQGGCPNGTGTGGPGYNFADEFDKSLSHNCEGILSMANSGPGTNGSQFFITLSPVPYLDGKHTVFGKVVAGMDIVKKIRQNDKIQEISIIRKGDSAKNFVVDNNFFNALKEKAKTKQEKKEKTEIEEQLKKIDEMFPDAITTDSGLKYIVQKKGTGESMPKKNSTVTTHYEGKLLTGQIFDSSYQRGEPIEFKVGQVIEGWNEALTNMKKGEKRTLIIPPELGYGKYGAGGIIPPNAWLIFEVELINFK